MTGASYGYAHTVVSISDKERDAVRGGFLSLSQLHNRPPSDAALDCLVDRLGVGRVWDALDRATRPAAKVPAANDNKFPSFGQRVVAALVAAE